MYKIYVKRNVLESLLLSDDSTENGVFDNMQYAVNQLQEIVAFCLISELKAILECFDIISVPEIALILKYSHEQCQWFLVAK